MENPYKRIIESSFSIDLNANDFFEYACAQVVSVNTSDIEEWIVPFVEEWGEVGTDVVLSYIQNQKPIPPYETERFKEAMEALMQKNPNVYSDWDYGNYYNEKGPYRKINKD
jgi:hypothetical protein